MKHCIATRNKCHLHCIGVYNAFNKLGIFAGIYNNKWVVSLESLESVIESSL